MISKNDRRLEALRELGAMIAEDLRRKRRGEATPPKSVSPVDENSAAEIPYVVEIQPDGTYAEIVKIEDLLGRKPRQRHRKNTAQIETSKQDN
jgi:hypothetical protein